jgi:hypothetical protein
VEQERAVSRIGQTRGAGDGIEAIIRRLFARMVDKQDADPESIAELLYPLHDFIIAGAVVPFATDVAYLLERINDNQPGLRILAEKRIKLTIETVAHPIRICGTMQIRIILAPYIRDRRFCILP